MPKKGKSMYSGYGGGMKKSGKSKKTTSSKKYNKRSYKKAKA
jgi:hypothetical protein